ncbi:class I SAM-dependent methyltransferase [Achromobacter xylosoxidans]|nr:class I SAM-dependent methyltransferase [Achromobacter xylosoxidans]
MTVDCTFVNRNSMRHWRGRFSRMWRPSFEKIFCEFLTLTASPFAATDKRAAMSVLRRKEYKTSSPILAPGIILQHLYVRERLNQHAPGRFIEIGIGRGHLSRVLLELGWTGTGFDLGEETLEDAARINSEYIDNGSLNLMQGNWLEYRDDEQVDLVVSCMVLEHLEDSAEAEYLHKAWACMKDGGLGILLVPGSPGHWGAEDDTAGHLRRYTPELLRSRLEDAGFTVNSIVGLTYPLSNMLLPLSDFLVRRSADKYLNLSQVERTKLSGRREIWGKTEFPVWTKLVLNRYILYPFHMLQKINKNNKNSLTLYAEFTK